ncbi:MAG: T9SS type A sorting domain-containing protein [bacterium]
MLRICLWLILGGVILCPKWARAFLVTNTASLTYTNCSGMDFLAKMSTATLRLIPQSAKIIRPGTGTSLSGELVVEVLENQSFSSVDFRYRKVGTTTWTAISTESSIFSSIFLTIWDTLALSEGLYELSAISKDNDGIPDPSPPVITLTIDHLSNDYVEGIVKKGTGTTIRKGNNISLYLPEDTVNSDTVLKIARAYCPSPPSSSIFAGIAIDISLENGQSILNKEITLTIEYEDNDNDGIIDNTSIQESSLSIYEYKNGTWEKLITQVDTNNNLCFAKTGNLSLFALLASLPPNLDNLLVFPNPFKKYNHKAIRFANLPLNSSISIFTISGELVMMRENVSSSFSWDIRNNKGEEVAGGVYIWVISDGGNKKRGRVGIIK